MRDYKIIKYVNNDVSIDVRFDKEKNTIWLTQSEIALVFGTTKNNVTKRLKFVLNGDTSDCESLLELTPDFLPEQIEILVNNQKTKAYNLDIIKKISKRSKSESGYEFINWAYDIINCNHHNTIPEISLNEDVKSKIYYIRGERVMLDFELAELYGYDTKSFNRQVQRNIDKFPPDFMFQLINTKLNLILKSQFVTSSWGGRRSLPYAFTEQGIYMLMTDL